jgi:hypothetical protein
VLIPLIRAAATIGFAIAPFSLGFVIIAVSEHLIRSIMVGHDPETLMSDLQNQFPNDALEILGKDGADLVARVVGSIERPGAVFNLPVAHRLRGIYDQSNCEDANGSRAWRDSDTARCDRPQHRIRDQAELTQPAASQTSHGGLERTGGQAPDSAPMSGRLVTEARANT